MNLKFKRHYKLLVLLALVAAILIVGLGGQRITPYTVRDGEQGGQPGIYAGKAITVLGQTVADSIQTLISDAQFR